MYEDFENSVQLGTPIELYEFTQGLVTYRMCSCAPTIYKDSQPYTPTPITRDRIKQSSDVFKDSVNLTFPFSNEFAAQFVGFSPEEVVTVTILRGHYGDEDEDYIIYWKGRILGANATENSIKLECESVFATIKRLGLGARFETNCRHALYLSGCNINREAYKHEGTILNSDGSTMTVSGSSAVGEGYFTGGIILLSDGTSRFITYHTGDSITISRPFSSVVTNQVVTLYAGCDHTMSTCNSKFDNLDNFGGFPFIPSVNPFAGTSIV